VAVLGRNFDLLVDHGMFLYLCGFCVSCSARTSDTIARKPEHDKPTCSCAPTTPALNSALRIAIV
jgi:hypothetical protein